MNAPNPPLPAGWSSVTMADVGEYINGRGFKKSEWAEVGVPIIRIQDLTGSRNKPHFFKGNADPQHRVVEGDLLVSWAATLGVYWWRGPDAVLNQHIFKVKSRIHRRFHYYALRAAIGDLYRLSHGSGMVHITKGRFERTQLSLPPFAEQERIVAAIESYFSRLDDAVAGLERAERNLRRYRASVLKAAVEGRLVPTEAELARAEGRHYEPASVFLERILAERRGQWKETRQRAIYKDPVAPTSKDLPALAEGWCWATVDQICHAVGDVDHKMPIAQANGIPYVSPKDFTASCKIDFERVKRISELDYLRLSRKIKPELDDVLLSRYGTIGQVVAVETDQRFQASYSVAILKLSSPRLRPYVCWALRSEGCQSAMRREVRASAQPDLGLHSIRRLLLPLPPEEEVRRIVENIERSASHADGMLAGTAMASVRIQRLRQSILKCAFEGRLADQDPTDEPAQLLLQRLKTEEASGYGREWKGR